ncbi:GDSL-type esterase/lipase family protein [Armatimonas rosea]|uniref:Lysophospholipase L1-like esterase n=1 Tax=Armatimonas rosea TaxID=685828 RepID=A0A7W9SSM2_ARMRO|nr:GDSL-type esterase/lipase family protein [Armatimonas rosea]MBB6051503.1 lysophospholipase L1-like esterase [Armatimonas rosea]
MTRIMPIGDSITEGGSTFVTYRVPLAEKLAKAGYQAEFVGSRQSFGLRHEGYGGKNAEFLAATVPANFQKFPAEVVLIHAGHNHFVEEKPVAGILAATESLITALRTIDPKVVVLLAQVIPAGKLPKYAYIPELNVGLAALAKRLKVIGVDQATGFDWHTDTIADHVHPNAQGAEKLALRWFDALQRVVERR